MYNCVHFHFTINSYLQTPLPLPPLPFPPLPPGCAADLVAAGDLAAAGWAPLPPGCAVDLVGAGDLVAPGGAFLVGLGANLSVVFVTAGKPGTLAVEGATVAAVVVVTRVVTSAVVAGAVDIVAVAVKGELKVFGAKAAVPGKVGDTDEAAGVATVPEGVVGVGGTVVAGLTMLLWELCAVNPLEEILLFATISVPTK